MKRGSERSESKILSILRKIHSPLIANLFVSPLRDTNSAGRGERLDTRGDIDAVAKDGVVREQNVADVNAYADSEPRIGPGCGLEDARATDRIDRALKARKRAVAQVTQNSPVESMQNGAKQLAMIVAYLESLMLVAAHYRGVARDIAEHDRGQLALRSCRLRVRRSRHSGICSIRPPNETMTPKYYSRRGRARNTACSRGAREGPARSVSRAAQET